VGLALPASPAGSRRASSRRDLGAVRAWAKSNGHEVSDRGRISAAVQQAYDAAQ
jgi:nucleoid-associated protein Lsr2